MYSSTGEAPLSLGFKDPVSCTVVFVPMSYYGHKGHGTLHLFGVEVLNLSCTKLVLREAFMFCICLNLDQGRGLW
jgi:hypothetical protein